MFGTSFRRIDSTELILKTPPTSHPSWNSYLDILKHSIKGSVRSFLLAYLLRTGVSFLIRLAAVWKRKATLLLAIQSSFLGRDTIRFASMVGTFSFLHKLISNGLLKYTGRYMKRNSAIAGCIASLSVLLETPENRVTIAQQFSMRAVQAGKNAFKQRNLFYFPHADALGFALAAASIMYAYTIYPKSIPRSYYSWVVQHGRVPKEMVELNRENSIAAFQGNFKSYSTEQLQEMVRKYSPTIKNRERLVEYLSEHSQTLPSIPCCLLHSSQDSCSKYCVSVWFKTFLDMIPVYSSLNIIPLLILKTRTLLDYPGDSLKRVIENTTRSCSFLSTYVFLFQSGLCLHRNMFPHTTEPRFLFYFIGFFTGLGSIFVEQKSKRAELAMYVFPKGLQSLYELSVTAGSVPKLPSIDVVATMASFSVIMGLIQKAIGNPTSIEPHQLSPLMYKLIKNIVGVY